MKRTLPALCLAVSALLPSGSAPAQNVVGNGTFNGDITTGWGTYDSFAGASFDNTQDCCGDGIPGSLRSVPLNNNEHTITSQCVTYGAAGNPTFGLGAWIKVNAIVAGANSHATVVAQFSTDPACAFGFNVGSAFAVGPAGAGMLAAPWTLFSLTSQTTPAGAAAAFVSITTRRASATHDVSFDHISLAACITDTAPPTVTSPGTSTVTQTVCQ